jgi:hypothetical protein
MHVLFKKAVYFIISSHLSSPDLVECIYCFTNGYSCTELRIGSDHCKNVHTTAYK